MTNAMLHTLPHPSKTLTLFAWMCDCIRTAIAPHTGPEMPRGPLLYFFHNYLSRLSARLDRLFTRWRNGTIAPPRPRASRPGKPPRMRLPQARMWLIKAVQKTAIAYEQLGLIMADPEFQQFLTEVPAAARLIAPLRLAVGQATPKRRPKAEKPPKPKSERARKPRAGLPRILFPGPS